MEYRHTPVLLAEVLKQLKCRRGSIFVDCTLGGAGHAGVIADLIAPDGILVGIDSDDAAIDAAKNAARFSQHQIVKGNFKEARKICSGLGIKEIDGFLFDLGLSSYQVDNCKRGFSYKKDGPLDMRIDKAQSLNAKEVLNTYSEQELTSVFKRYGEERWAQRIAKFIIEARKRKSLETTFDLVEVIKKAVPASYRRKGGHPARRIFQALRIEVNQELTALKQGLPDCVNMLKPKGRGAVIAYHSLEDRIVKNIFNDYEKGCMCPEDFPVCKCGKKPQVKVVTRKPIRPSEAEVKANPRARSAKLRVIEKI